ncbi:tetraspanin [Populus alba x Populus x berolinensis]|nr:tetraspanin [Populus alba x Populus x berolinensis]
MVIIFLLLLLETLVAADILLNSDWEKDLPEDPTGRFHDFREFVESNFDFFKWIAMFIILVQGFSILLAMTLRALGPNNGSKYDIDEEYTSARLPLINPHSQTPPYVVGQQVKEKPPYCNLQFDTERHESRVHCRDRHFGLVEELGIERELMEATGIF